MPVFAYESSNRQPGGPATIEAPDRASAIRQLTERGVMPRSVIEVGEARQGEASLAAVRSSLSRPTMSRFEMARLVGEMAIAIRAGLPLVQALRTIARQRTKPAQKALLERLIDAVEQGSSLSDAMREIGRRFPDLIINLVHSGEMAGRLGEVLTQAALLLNRDVKLRRALAGALIYPAIITVAVVIAITVVVTVIVPRVLSAVEGQLVTLPLPTRIVQGVAHLVGGYWWLILLIIALLLWGGSRLYNHPPARLALDRFMLRVPVLGSVLRDVAVARFTRTFGTLIEAGLPVLTSLRITRKTLGNRAMEHAIETICDDVSSGRTIADPLEQSGYFPPMLVQVVGLGERTGKLDEMLMQAADAFEEKTEQSISLFTTVLPPILIICLAAIVGFVVLSIFLPLIELQEALG
ncbi:MAG: type II secretion system F family protein [Phycisphaerales bacterium]|nr:type II secretion system F family protein [Phycisphaerales bacterium]